MELLTFMAANPWLSFFCLLVLSGLLCHLLSAVKDMYINTIWCVRGIPPVPILKFDQSSIKALDEAAAKATSKKKEDDENKLKDCR